VHRLFVGYPTNSLCETGQMAVCCQNLPLGALSSRSASSVLVGELFKKFGLFLNTGVHGHVSRTACRTKSQNKIGNISFELSDILEQP
jgi:hypothetical protein